MIKIWNYFVVIVALNKPQNYIVLCELHAYDKRFQGKNAIVLGKPAFCR